MRDKKCEICCRPFCYYWRPALTENFVITFDPTKVCGLCGMTITRAVVGFIELLSQAHGEKRERVLARLIESLNQNGFDTADLFPSPKGGSL